MIHYKKVAKVKVYDIEEKHEIEYLKQGTLNPPMFALCLNHWDKIKRNSYDSLNFSLQNLNDINAISTTRLTSCKKMLFPSSTTSKNSSAHSYKVPKVKKLTKWPRNTSSACSYASTMSSDGTIIQCSHKKFQDWSNTSATSAKSADGDFFPAESLFVDKFNNEESIKVVVREEYPNQSGRSTSDLIYNDYDTTSFSPTPKFDVKINTNCPKKENSYLLSHQIEMHGVDKVAFEDSKDSVNAQSYSDSNSKTENFMQGTNETNSPNKYLRGSVLNNKKSSFGVFSQADLNSVKYVRTEDLIIKENLSLKNLLSDSETLDGSNFNEISAKNNSSPKKMVKENLNNDTLSMNSAGFEEVNDFTNVLPLELDDLQKQIAKENSTFSERNSSVTIENINLLMNGKRVGDSLNITLKFDKHRNPPSATEKKKSDVDNSIPSVKKHVDVNSKFLKKNGNNDHKIEDSKIKIASNSKNSSENLKTGLYHGDRINMEANPERTVEEETNLKKENSNINIENYNNTSNFATSSKTSFNEMEKSNAESKEIPKCSISSDICTSKKLSMNDKNLSMNDTQVVLTKAANEKAKFTLELNVQTDAIQNKKSFVVKPVSSFLKKNNFLSSSSSLNSSKFSLDEKPIFWKPNGGMNGNKLDGFLKNKQKGKDLNTKQKYKKKNKVSDKSSSSISDVTCAVIDTYKPGDKLVPQLKLQQINFELNRNNTRIVLYHQYKFSREYLANELLFNEIDEYFSYNDTKHYLKSLFIKDFCTLDKMEMIILDNKRNKLIHEINFDQYLELIPLKEVMEITWRTYKYFVKYKQSEPVFDSDTIQKLSYARCMKDDAAIIELRHVLAKLPRISFISLKALFLFFKRLIDFSQLNLSKGFGAVFGELIFGEVEMKQKNSKVVAANDELLDANTRTSTEHLFGSNIRNTTIPSVMLEIETNNGVTKTSNTNVTEDNKYPSNSFDGHLSKSDLTYAICFCELVNSACGSIFSLILDNYDHLFSWNTLNYFNDNKIFL